MRMRGFASGAEGRPLTELKMPEEETPSAEMYFGAKRSHESTCTCPARRENEAVEKAVLQDAKAASRPTK